MMIKTSKILAVTIFALALGQHAWAGDPAAKAAEDAAVAVKAQVQAESKATAESAATPETAAQAATEKSAAEADTSASTKSEMSFEEKVTVYNKDQEDDDKVICRRVKKTGTRLASRRCVTAAQARREREDAQEALQRASRGTNTGPIN